MQFTKTILLTFIIGILQAHCGMTVPMTGTSRSSSTPADCCIDLTKVDACPNQGQQSSLGSSSSTGEINCDKVPFFSARGTVSYQVVPGEDTETDNRKAQRNCCFPLGRISSMNNKPEDSENSQSDEDVFNTKKCKEFMDKAWNNVGGAFCKVGEGVRYVNENTLVFARKLGRCVGKMAKQPLRHLGTFAVSASLEAAEFTYNLACFPIFCCMDSVDACLCSDD